MKKNLLCLLLAFLMLMGLLPETSHAEQYTALIIGGSLKLRSAPAEDSKVINRYRNGTKLIVLENGEEYCKVKTPDKRTGYMLKQYLEFPNGEPPMPTPTPTLSPAPTPTPASNSAVQNMAAKASSAPDSELISGDALQSAGQTKPEVSESASPTSEAQQTSNAESDSSNAPQPTLDPSKPMIALTFDDGPSDKTQRIAEIFYKEGVHCTFFIQGRHIAGNEEILRTVVKMGHQVASHTWSHPDLRKLSAKAIESQLTRTNDAFEEATGQKLTMLRPPFGNHNRYVRKVAEKLGIPLIMWSIDSEDWKTHSSSQTYRAILNNAKNGDIVLCHDLYESTVRAMEKLVPELIQKGYQLVTVETLMSFRKEALKPGQPYSHLDSKNLE